MLSSEIKVKYNNPIGNLSWRSLNGFLDTGELHAFFSHLMECWPFLYGAARELVWNLILIYKHFHLQNFGCHSTCCQKTNGYQAPHSGLAIYPLSK